MLIRVVLVISVLVAVSGCCNDCGGDDIHAVVYKYDGSVQCGDTGTPLEIMQLELTGAGIEVSEANCGDDGLFRVDVCGADTGNINIYQIREDDLLQAQSLGFDLIRDLPDFRYVDCESHTYVYQNAGLISCQPGTGVTLAEMQLTLTNNGIDVLSASCGSDGLAYPAVCDGATGFINIYEISEMDLLQALGLGFSGLSALPDHQFAACPI